MNWLKLIGWFLRPRKRRQMQALFQAAKILLAAIQAGDKMQIALAVGQFFKTLGDFILTLTGGFSGPGLSASECAEFRATCNSLLACRVPLGGDAGGILSRIDWTKVFEALKFILPLIPLVLLDEEPQ